MQRACLWRTSRRIQDSLGQPSVSSLSSWLPLISILHQLPSALADRRPIGVWENHKARSHYGPLDKRRAERRLPHCPFIALKLATTDNMSDKIVGRQLEKSNKSNKLIATPYYNTLSIDMNFAAVIHNASPRYPTPEVWEPTETKQI
ncbi:hypothetical protein M434DRAFT_32199 [Hypoxylon sp. CO27-5]|nr:hypothetical protein M434DRAFT_32199 [Hypoxylon sp. CO27-5]